ncbi:hypothetical protein HPB47_016534 [Ixodes persulcatus]|uniref:Uncharacterized protein n=1 Tax=Ixodes persulcatus TaxID=34615 RepID=A0AC60QQR4_IXOPE|nr:hypothetical protein HPB47_016534 [Ixodes persulcatus]
MSSVQLRPLMPPMLLQHLAPAMFLWRLVSIVLRPLVPPMSLWCQASSIILRLLQPMYLWCLVLPMSRWYPVPFLFQSYPGPFLWYPVPFSVPCTMQDRMVFDGIPATSVPSAIPVSDLQAAFRAAAVPVLPAVPTAAFQEAPGGAVKESPEPPVPPSGAMMSTASILSQLALSYCSKLPSFSSTTVVPELRGARGCNTSRTSSGSYCSRGLRREYWCDTRINSYISISNLSAEDRPTANWAPPVRHQQNRPAPVAPAVEPPSANTEFANRLQLKGRRAQAVESLVLAVCEELKISAAGPEGADGELTWDQVFAELGDYAISPAIIEELKAAYEYQGFDAKVVAEQMAARGVSKVHEKEGLKVGAYMDRLTLVVIGLMRGANLDKVRKGMKEANKSKLDTLVRHYGLQSKPVDTAAITLPRVIATFPGLAMDVLKVVEMEPVHHLTMTGLVENYPRQMMFSAFPSLIPRDIPDVLLSAYLLYQHQVSLVINKDNAQKQQASLEGFEHAAMESNYVTQRQRVLRLVEEGWLHIENGKVSLTPAVSTALNKAAALYRTRK